VLSQIIPYQYHRFFVFWILNRRFCQFKEHNAFLFIIIFCSLVPDFISELHVTSSLPAFLKIKRYHYQQQDVIPYQIV